MVYIKLINEIKKFGYTERGICIDGICILLEQVGSRVVENIIFNVRL